MISTWSWFPDSHHMILHRQHPSHPRSITITTTTSASRYQCYYPSPWRLNDRCLPLPAANWNFIITGNKTLAVTSRTTTAILPTSPINSRRFIYHHQQQQQQQLEGHTSQPTPTVNNIRPANETNCTDLVYRMVSGQCLITWYPLLQLDHGLRYLDSEGRGWTPLDVQSAVDRPTARHFIQMGHTVGDIMHARRL